MFYYTLQFNLVVVLYTYVTRLLGVSSFLSNRMENFFHSTWPHTWNISISEFNLNSQKVRESPAVTSHKFFCDWLAGE